MKKMKLRYRVKEENHSMKLQQKMSHVWGKKWTLKYRRHLESQIHMARKETNHVILY
jgi:hypothetical protein